MKNFFSMFKYLKKYKKIALLGPLLIFLEVIMELFMPNIMANIINIGIGQKNFSYVIISIILMLVLTIIGIIGGIGSTYFSSKASAYASRDIRKQVFEKISKLSFLNLDKLKPGHLITIITNDITLIGDVLMFCLRLIFRVPIILIGSIIMSLIISPKLSLILLIIMPFMFILITIIMKKGFPLFQKMQDEVDNINSIVRENINGIRVIKSFVNEEEEIKKFDVNNKKLMNTTIKAVRIISLVMPISMLIINLSVIAVLWFSSSQIVSGNMQVGNVIAFIQYLSNILSALMMASMVIVMFSKSEASALRINEILNKKEDFKKEEQSVIMKNIKGKIEFKDVCFSYSNGHGDVVLKNINLIINPGETIGIIGSTGSGKTTLVNLINRFYDVTTGEILIDDINIKNLDIQFLRKKIGYAMQQYVIFSKTIKENIALGNKTTIKEIQTAAKISEAHDFIMAKENKYETVVEQKGTNLSGGQKQRISIARTVLMNPDILIFDDITSAIDMNTDKKIRKNIKNNFKNKTIIIIASRIASLENADKIIVIEDGNIVGFDAPKNLLKNNQFYKQIYDSQVSIGGSLND